MDEQEILAIIRTLLALERNYLAIERTDLAKLRTGLALMLIGPSASTALVYVQNFTPFTEPFYIEWLAYLFFILIAFFGAWLTYSAYSQLKSTKNMLKEIRIQEIEFAKKSITLQYTLKRTHKSKRLTIPLLSSSISQLASY